MLPLTSPILPLFISLHLCQDLEPKHTSEPWYCPVGSQTCCHSTAREGSYRHWAPWMFTQDYHKPRSYRQQPKDTLPFNMANIILLWAEWFYCLFCSFKCFKMLMKQQQNVVSVQGFNFCTKINKCTVSTIIAAANKQENECLILYCSVNTYQLHIIVHEYSSVHASICVSLRPSFVLFINELRRLAARVTNGFWLWFGLFTRWGRRGRIIYTVWYLPTNYCSSWFL